MEGKRHAADQPAAADRAEQNVRLGALGCQLIQRFEAGACLAGDDLRIVEGVQQGEVLVRRNLAGALGGDFLAGAFAVVGQHDGGAVAGGGVALGGRRVDRHDDGDGNAERLAGGSETLGEISRRIGDDAAPRLIG